MRQGTQRPQQAPDLGPPRGAGPQYPFAGLKIEGDSNVRLVSEDKTHRVRSSCQGNSGQDGAGAIASLHCDTHTLRRLTPVYAPQGLA